MRNKYQPGDVVHWGYAGTAVALLGRVVAVDVPPGPGTIEILFELQVNPGRGFEIYTMLNGRTALIGQNHQCLSLVSRMDRTERELEVRWLVFSTLGCPLEVREKPQIEESV